MVVRLYWAVYAIGPRHVLIALFLTSAEDLIKRRSLFSKGSAAYFTSLMAVAQSVKTKDPAVHSQLVNCCRSASLSVSGLVPPLLFLETPC